jgi:hypothetical protein
MRLILSMAIKRHRSLKQGDCKNAFSQGILPPDEITIIKPPIEDPEATKDKYWLVKRTLYGLCCCPQHWYMKIKLVLNQLGLYQNAYNPCLFTGFLANPTNPADAPSSVSLTLALGLYVDNFIYFLEDPAVEEKCQCLLKDLITVEFMGMVEWFLGTHFHWLLTPDRVDVNLSQTRFATHLVEETNVHLRNVTPDATPYCSGLPIDAIPESDKDEESPTFQEGVKIPKCRRFHWLVGAKLTIDRVPILQWQCATPPTTC